MRRGVCMGRCGRSGREVRSIQTLAPEAATEEVLGPPDDDRKMGNRKSRSREENKRLRYGVKERLCYGLSRVPHFYVEARTPGTSERDCRQRLYRGQ